MKRDVAISLLFFGLLIFAALSCQNDPPLPKEPASVVEQWQEWINKNNFTQARRLSTENAQEWIDWISQVLEESNITEETISIFRKVDCKVDSNDATCFCQIEEMGEIFADTFFLIKEKDQWLVNIPETELESSGTLDSLFQTLQEE